MESHSLVREAETEVSSTPTNKTHRDANSSGNLNNNRNSIAASNDEVFEKGVDSGRSPKRSLVRSHYRGNFGKDGIYASPQTEWSSADCDANRNALVAGRKNKETMGGNIDAITPRPTTPSSYEQGRALLPEQYRRIEDDMPFDQASTILATTENDTTTYTDNGAISSNHNRNPEAPDSDDSMCSPVSTRFESIWLSSPEQSPSHPNNSLQRRREVDVPENRDLEGNESNFLFPPPKYSGTYPMVFANRPESPSPANDRPPNHSSRVVYPKGLMRNNDNCPHEGTNNDDPNSEYVAKPKSKINVQQDRGRARNEQGQNLSAKNIKVAHKVRRRSRQRREQQLFAESSCTDDEVSAENYGAETAVQSTSLQERSYQAWKSRQKKTSNPRSKQGISNLLPNDGSNVSFGASDKIHGFQSNQHPYRNKDTEEDMSLDRSLNSEYTKTLESEVEDMFKDVLFIGNPDKSKPGRRKYKHKPEVKRKLKMQQGSTMKSTNNPGAGPSGLQKATYTNDEKVTANVEIRGRTKKNMVKRRPKNRSRNISTGDDLSSLASTISQASSIDSRTIDTLQSEKYPTGDPMDTMISLVEGGLSVVTSAIGYALDSFANDEGKGHSIGEGRKSKNDYDILEYCGIDIGNHKIAAETDGPTRYGKANDLFKKVTVGYPEDLDSTELRENKLVMKSATRHRSIGSHSVNQEFNIDKDFELSNLALHAARSVHKLQGVEYDESVVIDMYKEIRLCSVTLKLPLGIVFLENDGGCFVTKVSPDGSAALSHVVEVGDQLASINGAGSSKMKVDDICNAVRLSSDPDGIELVFVRYVGPFRSKTKSLKYENPLPHDIGYVSNNTNKKLKPLASNERKKSDPIDVGEDINGNGVSITTDGKSIVLSNKKNTKRRTAFRMFGRGKTSTKNVEGKD